MARGLPVTDDAVPIDGRCFAYVFPCRWEDHCKIGFSNDPLGRIGALHPRWYEFFDVAHGTLVEAESVRDARDLELELRASLRDHNAPAPLTISMPAGGKTEWFRGVGTLLQQRIAGLAERGYRVYPLDRWLRTMLVARSDRLHEWSLAMLGVDELDGLVGRTPAQRKLRDALDAYRALDVDIAALLPDAVLDWYRRPG